MGVGTFILCALAFVRIIMLTLNLDPPKPQVKFVMSEETTLADLLALNLHKFEDEVYIHCSIQTCDKTGRLLCILCQE